MLSMLKAGLFAKKPSVIPIMEDDSEPSPLPIYMDMQTARHIGGQRAAPAGEPDALDNFFDTLQLQTMQARRRLPKEMRLVFEAEQEILRSPAAQQQSGVVVQPENLWQTYDTVSRIHFERDGGAIRSNEGDPIKLVSKACFGLYANVLAVGFLFGAVPSLYLPPSTKWGDDYSQLPVTSLMTPLHPLFNASVGFTLFPASLRLFLAFFSDSYPFLGYRRKSYMVGGWVVAALGLLCTGLLALSSDDSSLLPSLLVATIGVTVADVAGDARMVEFAQRERLSRRGNLQALYVGIKFAFTAAGQLYIALFRYGQASAWTQNSAAYSALVFTLALVALMPVPFIWTRLVEEKAPPVVSLRDRCNALFGLLKKKSISQILVFQLVYSFLSHLGSGSGSFWKRHHVDLALETQFLLQNTSAMADAGAFAKSLAFTQGLMVSGGLLCFALPMLLCRSPLATWNWRVTFFGCTMLICVLGAAQASFVAFDTSRGPLVWYLLPLLVQFPMGIRFILSLFPIVEVAEPAYEATISTLLFTAQLAPIPLATMLFSLLEAPTQDRLRAGVDFASAATQQDVSELSSYGALIGFSAILSLCWLPTQKVGAQVMRKFGGTRRRWGQTSVALGAAATTVAVVASFLSLLPSLGCVPALGDSCRP
ncbi:Folate-Biopterin Transporter (FBT) Family [Achlya hypogyna]|uniref:Folate-Biopterin Transporter (FBT) Family n=1 Tax=Achlya hypogyna TaxID=1202772 RepID=A0A1V9YYM4_ACHHY|nr:Folate-Biopterin Transporter (FBT) Family [Achlya hypogyna]